MGLFVTYLYSSGAWTEVHPDDVRRGRDGNLDRMQYRYWAERLEFAWQSHPQRVWTVSMNGSDPQMLAGSSFTDTDRAAHSRYDFVGELSIAAASIAGETALETRIYSPLSTSALHIPEVGPPVRHR